jgi:hypothetical protein
MRPKQNIHRQGPAARLSGVSAISTFEHAHFNCCEAAPPKKAFSASTYMGGITLENSVSDAAEEAAARLNRLFEDLLACARDAESALLNLTRLRATHAKSMRPHFPARYDAAICRG